jgi:hypothetical protein
MGGIILIICVVLLIILLLYNATGKDTRFPNVYTDDDDEDN